MAVAVVLALDLATTARIFGLAKALPDITVRQPGWMPHIVLASYGDAVDVADVDAALATATDSMRLPVTVAGIGVFPGDPVVLSLLPVPTVELMALHTNLHGALADLPSRPEYEIGNWIPQVSLGATTLPGDCAEVLAARWPGQMIGWAVSLDLIRLDTWDLLSSRPLRDG